MFEPLGFACAIAASTMLVVFPDVASEIVPMLFAVVGMLIFEMNFKQFFVQKKLKTKASLRLR